MAKRFFRQGEDSFRNYSIDKMIELMDVLEVARAIVTTVVSKPR